MQEGLGKYTDIEIKQEARMREDQREEKRAYEEPIEVQPVSTEQPAAPQEYDCVCSECGKDTTVPFLPKKEWPVYCRDCYSKRRR